VLLQQLEAVLRVGRGEDSELIAESAGEVLQRLLLVIYVEDGKFIVIVWSVHDDFFWQPF
jgi:hypothetical protein